MVYAFVILLLVFCWYRFDVQHDVSNRRFFYWLEFVVLVLVAGLRYRVGGDTLSYMDKYLSLNAEYEFLNYSFQYSSNGLLWYALMAICQKLSSSFILVQLVIAFFINYAFFKFADKHCSSPFLAVLLYSVFFFFYFNTEVLRATCVVSIFLLWGYDALCERKWVKYIILSLIAANFHIEGLFLLAYPLAFLLGKIRINVYKVFLLLILAIIVLFTFEQLPSISWFLQYSEALEYRDGMYSILLQNRNVNYYLAKILFILPVVWSMFSIGNQEDENTVLNKGLMIFYVFFMIQAINFPVYFSRFCDCIMPITIVVISNIIAEYRFTNKPVAVALLAFSLFVGCIQYRGETYYKYFPYHSIFNPVEERMRENLFNS